MTCGNKLANLYTRVCAVCTSLCMCVVCAVCTTLCVYVVCAVCTTLCVYVVCAVCNTLCVSVVCTTLCVCVVCVRSVHYPLCVRGVHAGRVMKSCSVGGRCGLPASPHGAELCPAHRAANLSPALPAPTIMQRACKQTLHVNYCRNLCMKVSQRTIFCSNRI